jgi:hypothetical protein
MCSNCLTTSKKSKFFTKDGNKYCLTCLKELYPRCYNCKKRTKRLTLTKISNCNICPNCIINDPYYQCADCEDYFNSNIHPYIILHNYNNDKVCDSCQESYSPCSICRNHIYYEDIFTCNLCNTCYCGNCRHSCNEMDDEFKFLDGKPCKEMPFDRYVGVEIELMSKKGLSKIPNVQRGSDGSISTVAYYSKPIELRVYPAKGDTLIKHITDVTNAIKECKVNDSCGLHIHLDLRDQKTSDDIYKFFNIYLAFEDCLYAMLPPLRIDGGYSRPLRQYKYFTRQDINYLPISTGRYLMSNFTALNKHNTLEIRGHSGTLSHVKILNWIYINLSMLEYAKTYDEDFIKSVQKMPLSKEKVKLFANTFKLPDNIVKYYYARVKLFHSNPKLINDIMHKYELLAEINTIRNTISQIPSWDERELLDLKINSLGKEIDQITKKYSKQFNKDYKISFEGK